MSTSPRGGIRSALLGGALLGIGILVGMRLQKAPPATPPPVKTAAERPTPAEAPQVRAPVADEPRPSPVEVEKPHQPIAPAARPVIPTQVSEAQRAAVVRRWGKAAPAPKTDTRIHPPPQAASMLSMVDERLQAGDRAGALEMYRKAQVFTTDPDQRELIRFEATSLYEEESEAEALGKLLDEIGRTTTRLDVQVAAAERLDRLEKARPPK